MEQPIIQALSSYGALGVVAFLLWKKIDEKDKQNREDTTKQIDKLEQTNKEDKLMFNKAIDSFNEAVGVFVGTRCKIDRLEQDVSEIKNKLDK